MAFVTIRSFTSSLAEGTDGPIATFTFVIGRTPSASGLPAGTVSYSIAGTGLFPTNALDFLGPLAGNIAFAAGQTTALVSVQIRPDLALEANETFRFALTGGTAGLLPGATTSAVATILNDDTVVGTALSDLSLAGTAAGEGISGRAGNDVILGSLGNDVINGGDGFDQIRYDLAGIGPVTLLADGAVAKGGGGTDRLFNMERITASAATIDTIDGRTADPAQTTSFVINLGAAPAFVGGALGTLAASGLRVNGVPGVGAISFTAENFDNVFGTRNNDVVVGSAGNNVLSGEGGNDTFFGSFGNDTFTGGAGVDTIDYSTLGRAVTLLPGGFISKSGAGTDRALDFFEVFIGAAGFANTLDASFPAGPVPPGGQTTALTLNYSLTGAPNVTVTGLPIPGGTGSYTLVNFVNARGTANADSLTGNAAANSFSGNGGNDVLRGLGGNDSLDGGDGNDTVEGGDGNDRVIGGFGDDFATGGAGDDSVSGGEGNDVMDGGLGNDTLIGGGGADTITDSSGANTVDAGAGNDFVDLFGSVGPGTLNGGFGNDTMFGGSGDDVIIGGAGADVLVGDFGADTYRYLAASDSAPGARDRLDEFWWPEGDVIDVSAIDANTLLSGNQAFTQVLNRADFTGAPGQISVLEFADIFVLRFDTNGDRVSNFEIEVAKGGAFQPGAGFTWLLEDFIL